VPAKHVAHIVREMVREEPTNRSASRRSRKQVRRSRKRAEISATNQNGRGGGRGSGGGGGGESKPKAKAQRNFTDPESRIMKTGDGYIQGYNAQLAVDAHRQIIVAHDVVAAQVDAPYCRRC
jgi:hypothetical protein